jgi:hypothetical protein
MCASDRAAGGVVLPADSPCLEYLGGFGRAGGLCQFLFLVALFLDNARLGRVLETIARRNKGAPRNEDGDLRP